MSASNKGGQPPVEPPDGKKQRLTLAEFKRLIEEARERGEDTGPIVKRMVLQTIAEVREGLKADGRPDRGVK